MERSHPKTPDAIEGKMTPLEVTLARRVHNQRRRLRQWEEIQGWHTFPGNIRRMYAQILQKQGAEIRALKAARPFWHRLLDLFNVKP